MMLAPDLLCWLYSSLIWSLAEREKKHMGERFQMLSMTSTARMTTFYKKMGLTCTEDGI